MLVCGTFPRDTKKEVMESFLKKELRKAGAPFKECWCPKKRFHLGKVSFNEAAELRGFLQRRHKIMFNGTQIWFSIESTEAERTLARPFSAALGVIRGHIDEIPQSRARKSFDLEYDYGLGVVWWSSSRILERSRQGVLTWTEEAPRALGRTKEQLEADLEQALMRAAA